MCSGPKCASYDRCFVTLMHQRASESDIIIVNHHLFFADLALRRENNESPLLPKYQAVVFDEAHEIDREYQTALYLALHLSRNKGDREDRKGLLGGRRSGLALYRVHHPRSR